jgi:hypothetical protein
VKPNIVQKIKLLCDWTDSNFLPTLFTKMMKDDRFELVIDDSEVDLYVIFNTTKDFHIPEKSVVFQMEPKILYNRGLNYKRVYTMDNSFSNLEWHLSKNYSELLKPYNQQKSDLLSVILSDKYFDEGHKFRVDLVIYLDKTRTPIKVFGNRCWTFLNSYDSTELPSFNKDVGLFPFKYHLAVENTAIKGYTTEKLVDGILSECLTFYWGGEDCIINENAFIRLDKNMSFEDICETINECIRTDEWSKRIDNIRIEKLRIINNLTVFSRI